MTRPASYDLARLAVVLTAGVDEPSLAKPEPAQVAADRASIDDDAQVGEFVGDPSGGPLVLTPPCLNLLDHLGWRCSRAVVRRRGSILQTGFAVLSPPVDPLGRTRPRVSDALQGRPGADIDAYTADLLTNAATAVLDAVSRQWVRSGGSANRSALLDQGFIQIRVEPNTRQA